MKGKLIGLIVSILVIVAVAIALIAGVRHANKVDSPSHHNPLFSSSKPVQAICGPTDFKEACVQSLSSVSHNQSSTPKDYVRAAINATIAAVQKGLEQSEDIGKEANDRLNQLAFEDCKELLQFAIEELQETFTNVADGKAQTMTDNESDLKNWLSATISYQQSCLDDIEKDDLKQKMSSALVNASRLSSNILAIVSEITPILNNFGIETNVSLARRLLHVPKVDKTGYPTWLSDADRKLLGRINANNPRPNVIVAQDGSGQFKTISQALAAYPKNLRGRYVIYVKAGIYNEHITINKDQVNIFMYGDGPRRTIVTGRQSVEGTKTPTYLTATFAVIGNGFIGKSMGFQNTAGPEGHQAVALRVQSDMSVFYNCRMDGYQDTLYTQTHRQFYRNCVVSGTVDFIFGDASAMIQNTLIIVRMPMKGQDNTVTAQGKYDRNQPTGIVIHNCRIVPEERLFPMRFNVQTFLGRPWKQYSTTVVMESMLADFIQPTGWMPWEGKDFLSTLFYAEFANRGPGAITTRRVRWKGFHVLTNRNDALKYTVGPFIRGNLWLKYTGTPYFDGLRH